MRLEINAAGHFLPYCIFFFREFREEESGTRLKCRTIIFVKYQTFVFYEEITLETDKKIEYDNQKANYKEMD